MTPQDILLASLDYKQVLKRVGIELTLPMHQVMNGLVEYLSAIAQIREGQLQEPRS